MAKNWRDEYDKLVIKNMNLAEASFRQRQQIEELSADVIRLQAEREVLQRQLRSGVRLDRAIEDVLVGNEAGGGIRKIRLS